MIATIIENTFFLIFVIFASATAYEISGNIIITIFAALFSLLTLVVSISFIHFVADTKFMYSVILKLLYGSSKKITNKY